jgi:hypothetical protein
MQGGHSDQLETTTTSFSGSDVQLESPLLRAFFRPQHFIVNCCGKVS